MPEKRFDQIDRRFDQLTADLRAEMKAETGDLRRHMGVLHEDLIDRNRGIGETDSLRQEMRAGFAMMMKRFDDHAIPGYRLPSLVPQGLHWRNAKSAQGRCGAGDQRDER